jgi:hypothetical protein
MILKTIRRSAITIALLAVPVEGKAAVTRRRTFVLRKVGRRWLISHFHASDLMPPAR